MGVMGGAHHLLPLSMAVAMRSIPLAGTRLSSSRLGFGCSGLHQVLRHEARQDLLAAAFDHGIRYFDTAPYYGHGLAEQELGCFAGKRRGQIIIATKFGVLPDPLMSRLPAAMYARLGAQAALRKLTRRNTFAILPKRNYGAEYARHSIERSLRALAVDHIDILFLHQPQLALLADADGLVRTLDALKGEGKFRHLGLAGDARDCVDIAQRHPALAEIMQINVARGRGELALLAAASLPCHATFGHFRGKQAALPLLLKDAVTANPRGVILFSTRRVERLREMVELFRSLEPR
jgi:aryl-alcohol dehydrogenase-like predicted oxidoreductase